MTRDLLIFGARADLRAAFAHSAITDAELYDQICFLASHCGPDQAEHKERLLTIAADLDADMVAPDADAFKRYPGPATLETYLDRP